MLLRSALAFGFLLAAATAHAQVACSQPACGCAVDCQAPCASDLACGDEDWCQDSCLCLPCLQVYGGAVYLTRSDPSSRPLLVNTTPVNVFDASDLNFDWQPGWEVGLRRQWGEFGQLDLRYLQVDSIEATGGVGPISAGVGFPTTNGMGNAAGIFGGMFNPSADLLARTELESAEANVRYLYSDWLWLLGGFRFINLEDRLQGSFVNLAPAATNDIGLTADNDMYGLQGRRRHSARPRPAHRRFFGHSGHLQQQNSLPRHRGFHPGGRNRQRCQGHRLADFVHGRSATECHLRDQFELVGQRGLSGAVV